MELRPPDPCLRDERVVLREWTLADVPAVAKACRDPEIVRWTTQIPEGYTEEHARAWLSSVPAGWAMGTADFAVVDAASGAVAGAVGLVVLEPGSAAIGYWIAAEHRRNGLASSAVRLVSTWAEGQGLQRLQLTILIGNELSARVARNAGYRQVDVLPASVEQRGALKEATLWARLTEPRPGA